MVLWSRQHLTCLKPSFFHSTIDITTLSPLSLLPYLTEPWSSAQQVAAFLALDFCMTQWLSVGCNHHPILLVFTIAIPSSKLYNLAWHTGSKHDAPLSCNGHPSHAQPALPAWTAGLAQEMPGLHITTYSWPKASVEVDWSVYPGGLGGRLSVRGATTESLMRAKEGTWGSASAGWLATRFRRSMMDSRLLEGCPWVSVRRCCPLCRPFWPMLLPAAVQTTAIRCLRLWTSARHSESGLPRSILWSIDPSSEPMRPQSRCTTIFGRRGLVWAVENHYKLLLQAQNIEFGCWPCPASGDGAAELTSSLPLRGDVFADTSPAFRRLNRSSAKDPVKSKMHKYGDVSISIIQSLAFQLDQIYFGQKHQYAGLGRQFPDASEEGGEIRRGSRVVDWATQEDQAISKFGGILSFATVPWFSCHTGWSAEWNMHAPDLEPAYSAASAESTGSAGCL